MHAGYSYVSYHVIFALLVNGNIVALTKIPEANHVIHDGSLVRGALVRVKSYQANMVKNKQYVFKQIL